MQRRLTELGFLLIGLYSTGYANTQKTDAGPFFNVQALGGLPAQISVTLCLNGNAPLSCQNYTAPATNFSINTTIPNRTYRSAGIKVNTPGYVVNTDFTLRKKDSKVSTPSVLPAGCQMNNNGFCIFAASDVTAVNFTAGSTFAEAGIEFNGGPVMGTTVNTIPHVYYIWYGDWSGSPNGQSIVNNFTEFMGGSAYYNILTTYYDNGHNFIKPRLDYNPNSDSYADPGSLGSTLQLDNSNDDILNIVNSAIAAKQWPYDPNGVYFVLTAPDVTLPGFCTQYCGWHTYATVNSGYIQYSFVGNAVTQCPNGCLAQTNSSPNGDIGVDGMVSVLAHELAETVTDPQLNAWYHIDQSGEIGDLCNFNFGTTQTEPTYNSQYNLSLNNFNYLVQQEWLNANSGQCVIGY